LAIDGAPHGNDTHAIARFEPHILEKPVAYSALIAAAVFSSVIVSPTFIAGS